MSEDAAPQTELEHKRAIKQLHERLTANLLEQMALFWDGWSKLGVPVQMLMTEVYRRMPRDLPLEGADEETKVAFLRQLGMFIGSDPNTSAAMPMVMEAVHDSRPDAIEAVLMRLLDEAPKMTDASGNPLPDTAPAFQGAVLTKAGPTLSGAIAKAPEAGVYKVLGLGGGEDGKPTMVETFFAASDIIAVGVKREVKVEAKPSIWRPS